MVSATSQGDFFEPSARVARAHAMKSCVSLIFALSGLAEREVGPGSRPRWEQFRSAAQRRRHLLAEDIAEECFGRTASSRGTVGCCDGEALVGSVAERLEPRAAEAGVEVSVYCGGGTIEGDGPALGEALFNTLTNAFEATPRGGCVLLETRQLDNGDQHWVIRDTGLGVPSHHLDRLRHLRSSGKEGGLALFRATLARLGGVLRIESDGCSGASVSILLPKSAVGELR